MMLAWAPVEGGRWDVTAQLGLREGVAVLAVWPSLKGDWTNVGRPTVAEVMELNSALTMAKAVLQHANTFPKSMY
jgi:hypothetical protein